MSNYINTINIPAYDTDEAKITATINALVANLNWIADADGVHVWADTSKKLGVYFTMSGSSIITYICNNIINVTSQFAALLKGQMTCIDYINSVSGNSLALGFRSTTSEINLTSIFAKNTNSEILALSFCSNASYMIKKDCASSISVSVPINSSPQFATSLCKLPDIINGCMFTDLYYVFSCPAKLSDLVVYIGGKNYRLCGNANYSKIAIPVS